MVFQRITESVIIPTVQRTPSLPLTDTVIPEEFDIAQIEPTQESLDTSSPYPGPEIYSATWDAYPAMQTPSLNASETDTENVNLIPASPSASTTMSSIPSPTIIITSTPLPPWILSKLKATDPKNFKLASGKYQLVEFFAFWSGMSQAMAPIMNKLELEYGDQINFIYLDIDNPANDQLKKLLKYKTAPQFLILDATGNVIKQWEGYVDESELIQSIESLLK